MAFYLPKQGFHLQQYPYPVCPMRQDRNHNLKKIYL